MTSLLKLAPGKDEKCEKVTDRRKDDNWSEKLTWSKKDDYSNRHQPSAKSQIMWNNPSIHVIQCIKISNPNLLTTAERSQRMIASGMKASYTQQDGNSKRTRQTGFLYSWTYWHESLSLLLIKRYILEVYIASIWLPCVVNLLQIYIFKISFELMNIDN